MRKIHGILDGVIPFQPHFHFKRAYFELDGKGDSFPKLEGHAVPS
jgi:hypothetical protein